MSHADFTNLHTLSWSCSEDPLCTSVQQESLPDDQQKKSYEEKKYLMSNRKVDFLGRKPEVEIS